MRSQIMPRADAGLGRCARLTSAVQRAFVAAALVLLASPATTHALRVNGTSPCEPPSGVVPPVVPRGPGTFLLYLSNLTQDDVEISAKVPPFWVDTPNHPIKAPAY